MGRRHKFPEKAWDEIIKALKKSHYQDIDEALKDIREHFFTNYGKDGAESETIKMGISDISEIKTMLIRLIHLNIIKIDKMKSGIDYDWLFEDKPTYDTTDLEKLTELKNKFKFPSKTWRMVSGAFAEESPTEFPIAVNMVKQHLINRYGKRARWVAETELKIKNLGDLRKILSVMGEMGYIDLNNLKQTEELEWF